jgi:hypothetical protein
MTLMGQASSTWYENRFPAGWHLNLRGITLVMSDAIAAAGTAAAPTHALE